jgi:hypothetical protein
MSEIRVSVATMSSSPFSGIPSPFVEPGFEYTQG